MPAPISAAHEFDSLALVAAWAGSTTPTSRRAASPTAASMITALTTRSLRKPPAGALRNAAAVDDEDKHEGWKGPQDRFDHDSSSMDTTGMLQGANACPSPEKIREKSS